MVLVLDRLAFTSAGRWRAGPGVSAVKMQAWEATPSPIPARTWPCWPPPAHRTDTRLPAVPEQPVMPTVFMCAAGLGMTVLAYDPYASAEKAAALGVQIVSWEEALERVRGLL